MPIEQPEYSTSSDKPDRPAGSSATRWHAELQTGEKWMRKFWERGRKVVKRYMDDQEDMNVPNDRYNVFWSNVGVLKASLYAAPPAPLVKRRYDDYEDDAARVGGLMMQRLLRQGFERPESDMQIAFCKTVEDRLVPGMGQIWLRYSPEVHETKIGDMVLESIADEHVITDYVYWEDFWMSPARAWEEVWWVARRSWMTRREFSERFGKSHASKVTWTKKYPDKWGDRVTPESMGIAKTEVFEIWCKPTKMVHFISRTCDYELDTVEDELDLEGFFPCPCPLLATHSTSSLLPKPDYLMVQTQYRRLDTMEMRIGLLEEAIQASGAYDKANKELGQILSGNSNKMIPVENWAMFAEKGGLKGVIDWFPMEAVATALDKLREVFREEQVKLYELTGISDIMRGVTAPRETLGAQKLKAQYSSVRLQYIQEEVANFVQNGLRIKAEIIAKHFQPESILKNSLIEFTPDKDLAQAGVQVLKSDWSRSYRIQIFADTLAIPDYNAEQQGRVEFITAMGQFLSQATQLLQIAPEAGPFLMHILKWGMTSFRSAASVEGIFDKAIRTLEQKLSQPRQPQPDPKMLLAQAEIQKMQLEGKMLQEKHQMDMQKNQQKVQLDAAKADMDMRSAVAKSEIEVENKEVESQVDMLATGAKTAAEIAAVNAKTQADIVATKMKTQAAIEATRAKAAASRAEANVAKRPQGPR